jgi:hypothetical protein
VQSPAIDDHFDRLAVAHLRARAEATDDARLTQSQPGGELADCTVVSDVLG